MGQRFFPCSAVVRGAASSADHQLVIGDRDDIRLQTILTVVAQPCAAFVTRRFKQLTEFRTQCRRMVFMLRG
jgi:hypothetical protein